MNYIKKLLFIPLFVWCSMPINVYTSSESSGSIEDAQMNDFYVNFFDHEPNLKEGFKLINVDLQSFQKQAFALLADMKLKYELSLNAQIEFDQHLSFLKLLKELGFPEGFPGQSELQNSVETDFIKYIQGLCDLPMRIVVYICEERIVYGIKALLYDAIEKNKPSTDPVFLYIKKAIDKRLSWVLGGVKSYIDQTIPGSPSDFFAASRSVILTREYFKGLTLLQKVLSDVHYYFEYRNNEDGADDIVTDQLNKVKILVSCGADINQKCYYSDDGYVRSIGTSPLDVAMLADSVDDMETFIALGAKMPNYYDHFITEIISCHADKILKHELEKDIPVDAEWLRDTAYFDNVNALRLLLQYPDKNGKFLSVNVLIDGSPDNGTPLLTIAARHNALNVMKELFTHKDLDVNYMKKSYILSDDSNAYRAAIQTNHMEAAKLLLEHGAIDKTTFAERVVGSIISPEVRAYYYSKMKLGVGVASMLAIGYLLSSKNK